MPRPSDVVLHCAVLGASGTVGGAVSAKLVERGHVSVPVVRRPAATSAAGPLAAVVADWNADALTEAFTGCSHAFLMVPLVPDAADLAASSFEAARRAGVGHVVRLSVLGAVIRDGTRLGQLHGDIDTALESLGVAHTILRPDSFMQNLHDSAPAIRAGALPNPMGDAAAAMVDAADIAACAVAAMEQSETGVFDVTGPQVLSQVDVARMLSAQLGHEVRPADMTPREFEQQLLTFGVSEYLAGLLADLAEWTRDCGGGEVSPTVARLTGQPPRTLATFIRRHQAVFAAPAANTER